MTSDCQASSMLGLGKRLSVKKEQTPTTSEGRVLSHLNTLVNIVS